METRSSHTQKPCKCEKKLNFISFLCRFYFKRSTDDRDCEVVYEEVKEDSAVLPTFDGKVVGKVERVDS